MSERNPALAPFDALIGTWDTESKHRLIDEVVSGQVTYEWLAGDRFIVLRSHNDHELIPDAISVIGPPEEGDGLVLEYFDSRGVRRTYHVAIEDGVMRWWRDAPGFDQRMVATLGENEFEADIELAQAPGEWRHDMKVTYRRRA
jgi:hypothetical protein